MLLHWMTLKRQLWNSIDTKSNFSDSWLIISVYLLTVLCCVCIPSSLRPGTDTAGVPACPHPAVLRPRRQQRLVAGWVQGTERIRPCQLPWQDVLCLNRQDIKKLRTKKRKKKKNFPEEHSNPCGIHFTANNPCVRCVSEETQTRAQCDEHFFCTSVL